MSVLVSKLLETVKAVAPISLLVFILHLSIAPLDQPSLVRFFIGTVCIILGLSIFLFGVDIAIAPVGAAMGNALARKKSVVLMLGAGIVLGFFLTTAEPDLLVVAGEIALATGGVLGLLKVLLVVSIGVAVMVAVGLWRIIAQHSVRLVLFSVYAVIGLLAVFVPSDFFGIAFDTGGAVTGPMTAPFILAMSVGLSSVHGGLKAEADSFGLTAIASAGPMVALFIMAILTRLSGINKDAAHAPAIEDGIFSVFVEHFQSVGKTIALAILPIVIITLIAQKFLLHLPKRKFKRVLKGFIYTYMGCVLFLVGANAGFMGAGFQMGEAIANRSSLLVVAIGGLIGLLVITAEPCVHVISAQIEDATGGAVSGRAIRMTFALGISLAIALSVLRLVVPSISLWYFLLPGYALALLLTRYTPDLFVGIAFDSGGVACGPMTATFVLAFAQGVAYATSGAQGLVNAFGVIALVALMPLIALQLFGILYHNQQVRQARLKQQSLKGGSR